MRERRKHTPGPWKWVSREGFDSEYEWQCEYLTSPSQHQVLSVEDIYPGYAECGEHLVIKVKPEDAKLIESAPELLATSKTLLATCQRYLEEIGGCDHSVNICCCGLKREIAEAQAAIAKATN